ncbi:hypothetical protein V6N13_014477 [Hibiscus sabdariffa]|uniref:Uncharacterized protein n=1 Tax=Hibiscus sabdariffa TaxID=183260 RepID=A0ABR2RVF4_9ROSI
MDVGTTRGGARAFKLDYLLKLADVKGSDGKTTLHDCTILLSKRSFVRKEQECLTALWGRSTSETKAEQQKNGTRPRLGFKYQTSPCQEDSNSRPRCPRKLRLQPIGWQG